MLIRSRECAANFELGAKLLTSIQFATTALIATDGKDHLLLCDPITAVLRSKLQAHAHVLISTCNHPWCNTICKSKSNYVLLFKPLMTNNPSVAAGKYESIT